MLGRETAIQEAEWRDDDWLWLKNGMVPALEVEVPGTRDEDELLDRAALSTSRNGLPKDFQWLRTPEPERIFEAKDGKLRLFGRESIGSWFEQALVARRQTHFSYDAEVTLDFSPTDERQFAGLTGYYNRYNFHYLTVTAHSDGKRELLIMSVAGDPIGNLDLSVPPGLDPQRGQGAPQDRSARRELPVLLRARGRTTGRRSARCSMPRRFATSAAIPPASTATSPVPSSASPHRSQWNSAPRGLHGLRLSSGEALERSVLRLTNSIPPTESFPRKRETQLAEARNGQEGSGRASPGSVA